MGIKITEEIDHYELEVVPHTQRLLKKKKGSSRKKKTRSSFEFRSFLCKQWKKQLRHVIMQTETS